MSSNSMLKRPESPVTHSEGSSEYHETCESLPLSEGFSQKNLPFPFKLTGLQWHGLHMNMDGLLGHLWK